MLVGFDLESHLEKNVYKKYLDTELLELKLQADKEDWSYLT